MNRARVRELVVFFPHSFSFPFMDYKKTMVGLMSWLLREWETIFEREMKWKPCECDVDGWFSGRRSRKKWALVQNQSSIRKVWLEEQFVTWSVLMPSVTDSHNFLVVKSFIVIISPSLSFSRQVSSSFYFPQNWLKSQMKQAREWYADNNRQKPGLVSLQPKPGSLRYEDRIRDEWEKRKERLRNKERERER